MKSRSTITFCLRASFALSTLFLFLLASAISVRSAPPADNPVRLDLVGHSAAGGGFHGDIWVHGQFAYLGTHSCGTGVKIFDVSRPSSPQWVVSLVTNLKSTHDDVVVIGANTPAFHGDLLAVGNQDCAQGGAHGVQFWDVTNPRQARRLGFFDTGAAFGGSGVHELCLFQRNDRILALLAVPRSGKDFRIVDATDPRNPRQIADWGIGINLSLDYASLPQGYSSFVFCHSAWVNEEGTVAYLSYWDAGVIILDISDPGNPRFLGRTMYARGEEGNAHSVWPARGGKLFLVADEDFSPGGARVDITQPASLAGIIGAAEGNPDKLVCASGEVEGVVTNVGRGCNTDTYSSDPRGNIPLIEFGGCPHTEKILRAQAAGAVGVIVVNNPSPPANSFGNNFQRISIPVVTISQVDGNRMKNALSAGEMVRVRLGPDPNHSWGFLRIYDLSDLTSPRQISTFATERARLCPPPDLGWYSIHNPFVVGDTAYLSWYSDGVRVIDISDPAHPRESAFFVPPDRPDNPAGFLLGKALVWGVYVQNDLIYISDIDSGLFILRRADR